MKQKDYKRLGVEWGRKARKAESRSRKSTIKKPTREELAEVEFEKIMEGIRVRMANPPDKCERCDKPVTEFNRQWNGNDWFCDECAEETQQ